MAAEDVTPRIVSLTGGDTVNIVPRRAEAALTGIGAEEVYRLAEAFPPPPVRRLPQERSRTASCA
jgi:hypothetical protein